MKETPVKITLTQEEARALHYYLKENCTCEILASVHTKVVGTLIDANQKDAQKRSKGTKPAWAD